MLTQGRILVNQEVVHRAKHALQAGDEIEVLARQRAEERTPPPQQPSTVDLDILFEDATLLVVNKPHQLLSVATDRLEIDTLHSRCVEHVRLTNERGWCFIVHRLDKETSGVLAIAKNPDSYRHLAMQFERRTVEKIYHAVVEGVQDIEPIKVDRPIYTMSKGKVRIDSQQGKPATTLFKTGKIFKGYTLILCKPETGRMHQIRIHLSSVNMPIVGDTMYGGSDIYLSRLKKKFHLKKGTEEQPLIKRFALHAHSLKFKDLSGKEVEYVSEYPKDFAVLLKQLEKNS